MDNPEVLKIKFWDLAGDSPEVHNCEDPPWMAAQNKISPRANTFDQPGLSCLELLETA